MKTAVKIVAFLFVFIAFSCDNDNKNTWNEVLEGSQWKVLKIIDKVTSEEINFPKEAKNFEMIFRTNGKFKIINGCNYAWGTYSVNGNKINFPVAGPSTKMYCETISDFEDLFIRALSDTKSYTKSNNLLVLQADKYNIILEYIGKYDLTIGKVLFCTNLHILNCISEIEISIHGKKVGKIASGSQYNDNDCFCMESPPQIGKIFTLKEGKYNYTAINTKCKAVNITNKWSGTFTVKGDNCISVFLDVRPK